MSELRYTKEHEWARVEGDVAIVGISDYAQEQLGDVVYIELPEVGQKVERAAEAAVVESVKAASEIYAPLSGEVIEVNEALADEPEIVNADALGNGWLFKVKFSNASEIEKLMDETAYADYVESLE
jgi:glycine cleavage system H protein